MITFTHKGNFNNTEKFLKRMQQKEYLKILTKYAQEGVQALAAATPLRSGATASAWDYQIELNNDGANIYWTNDNENKGVNIAVILQYGHGTRNGGYVQGLDYINPAIRPIFDKIAEEAWKEVTSS